MVKAWLVLLILEFISWSQMLVVVTLVPIYVNSATSSTCFPSIITGWFTLVFNLRTCVFYVLILRRIVLTILQDVSFLLGIQAFAV